MFFRKFLASAGTDSRKCGCTSRMFCGMFLSVSIGVAPICTVATEAPQAIMMWKPTTWAKQWSSGRMISVRKCGGMSTRDNACSTLAV